MSEEEKVFEYIVEVYEQQYKVIGRIASATSEGLSIAHKGDFTFVTTERYTVKNLGRCTNY